MMKIIIIICSSLKEQSSILEKDYRYLNSTVTQIQPFLHKIHPPNSQSPITKTATLTTGLAVQKRNMVDPEYLDENTGDVCCLYYCSSYDNESMF